MTKVILGYFDMDNLGDDALKKSLIKNYAGDGKVVTINNASIFYKFIYLFFAEEILTSGGWLYDNFTAKLWCFFMYVARKYFGVKLRLIGVSVPEKSSNKYIRYVLENADELKLRDKDIPDIAFNDEFSNDSFKIGINLVASSCEGKEQKIRWLIIALKETFNAKVYLMPFSTRDRTALTRKKVLSDIEFLNRFKDIAIVLEKMPVDSMKYAISRMDAMICTRYHSHVFARMTNTSFVSFPYESKVNDFLKYHKYPEDIKLSNDIDVAEIINKIKRIKQCKK